MQLAAYVRGVVAISSIDPLKRGAAEATQKGVNQGDGYLSVRGLGAVGPVAIPDDIDRHVAVQDRTTMVVDPVALNYSETARLGSHCFCGGLGNVAVGSHVIAIGRRWTQRLRRQEINGQHYKKKGQENLALAKGNLH